MSAPLYLALRHIFAQGSADFGLVGGTALAGYYAGHRRSDDLDIFARDEASHRSATFAVKSLTEIGAVRLATTAETRQYHRTLWKLDGHQFTADVVLDANIFRVGKFIQCKDKVRVADFETLLKTKAATLVSRASEKDLYDLIWLMERRPDLAFENLIALGCEIDGGMNAESILISLTGTAPAEVSCDFGLAKSGNGVARRKAIHKKIVKFRREFIRALVSHLRGLPTPPLGRLVHKLRSPRSSNKRP